MLRLIALLLASTFSFPAFAATECAGETYTGTIVQVTVDTVGTMGAIQGGRVTISPKGGPVRSYEIRGEEIPQYFEDLDSGTARAMVGLSAFVDGNYPVQIRYVGINYEENLVKVLRDPARKKQSGNSLRVWKGPGFDGGQQHSFQDVVCSVSLDP